MRIPRSHHEGALRHIPESLCGSIRTMQGFRYARLATRRQVLIGTVAGTVALAGTALPLGFRGRILLGTTVGQVDVSGLGAAEARDVLGSRLAAVTTRPITLRIAERTWSSTLADLGFAVDLDATIAHALARGRDDGMAGQYVRGFGLGDTEDVPIVFGLDDALLAQKLAAIAKDAGTVAQPASLRLDGGGLVLDEGVAGIHLDPAAARKAVLEAVAHQPIDTIDVPAEFLEPTPSTTDLEPAFIHAQALTATPVTIDVDGQTWDLAPDELLAALVLPDDPVQELPWLDAGKLRDLLPDSLADGVSRGPTNARLAFTSGKVTVVQEAVPGRAVDPEATADAIAEVASGNGPRTVKAIFHETPAEIRSDTLAELGLTALMGTGTSSFAGSPEERRLNVIAAVEHITGTLVPAGETFSFLETVGPITVENGFALGKGVGASWFESSAGGGVCQISTTVFRAALFGALPIPEWYSHAYRIDYYEQAGEPVGIDCAIYQAESDEERDFDLRIQNPTGTTMYLQVTIDGDIATAEFYGSGIDLEAEVLSPSIGDAVAPPEPEVAVDDSLEPGEKKMLEPAHPGYEVSTTRIILEDGIAIDENVFSTYYSPRPELWLVGPEAKSVGEPG